MQHDRSNSCNLMLLSLFAALFYKNINLAFVLFEMDDCFVCLFSIFRMAKMEWQIMLGLQFFFFRCCPLQLYAFLWV